MRTIEVKVYKFDELSDEAKEHAISKHNEHSEYSWADDAMDSLKKFIDHFNGSLDDWSVDFLEPYRNVLRISLPDDMDEEDILASILSLGSYNKDTLRGDGECKLTGCCMDESLGDGIRKAWFTDGERDLRELVMAGISQWEADVREDCEWQYTEEYFADLCEANEYEFTEDGKLL